MVMRLAYLAVDRPDPCQSVRGLAGAMKGPKMNDWLKLKKVVRYLVNFPYVKRIFEEQYFESAMVVALSDSDWAGDITRRINQRVGHEVCIAYNPGGTDEQESGCTFNCRIGVLRMSRTATLRSS